MKKKGLSLLEMMIIVVIVGVLATVAFYASQTFFETSKDKVCRANLMVLKQALDFYILDHEVFPVGLTVANIPQKYIGRAYASVSCEGQSWEAKLNSFIESWKKEALVYALPLINSFPPHNLEMITCPKDLDPPIPSNMNLVSYGINGGLSGKTILDYQALSPTYVLIEDSDSPVMASPAKRHVTYGKSVPYALAIQKDGTVVQQ